MSSLSPKDRVSLCIFTYADCRRCRLPRASRGAGAHPRFLRVGLRTSAPITPEKNPAPHKRPHSPHRDPYAIHYDADRCRLREEPFKLL